MRILLVQRSIDPPGGGNAVAAWMLQALAGVHDVTTLTLHRWHPDRVDSFYGTSLANANIPQQHPAAAWQLLRFVPGALTRLRIAVLLRTVKAIEDKFDVLLTADNYAAFGRPGLQYLHYPAPLRPEPTRLAPLVQFYYQLSDRLSGLSWDSVRLNETLANSQWTAGVLQRAHGIAARVLYPPVVDPGPGLPWSERTNTFLCLGRFHGSKRFELVMSILARARKTLPDLRLQIVGSSVDREYTRRMRTLARGKDWITIDEDLTQSHLLTLMQQSRYAIHAMVDEHFGMAAAEMARAGCIVFVHDSGGQVEAIGDAPDLRWKTEDDAVARIRAVVQRPPAAQEALSARLRAHAEQFSQPRFVREFRAIVADYGAAIALKRGSRSSSS